MIKTAMKVLNALLLVMLTLTSVAQIEDPVQWKFTVEPLEDKTAEVVATATIQAKWHVYALKVSDDPNAIGPIPTSLKLNKSSDYVTKGSVKEGKFITHFDPNFEMDLNYFENKAVFRQKIELKKEGPVEISGVLEYMACDDSKCIFPDPVNFKVKYEPGKTTEEAPVETASAAPAADSGILNPVIWTAKSVSLGNGEYELQLIATMQQGWHVYSQFLQSNEGPVATTFDFKLPAGVERIGKVGEDKPETKYDPNFMMDLNFFSNVATFRQKIKVTGDAKPVVEAKVNFMCCNDETCLPPKDVIFKIDLATGIGTEFDPTSGAALSGPTKFQYKLTSIDLDNPAVKDCGGVITAPVADSSLWELFILGFLGGLVALLTPCVFPMIPLTVSFFTKGSENKRKGFIRAATYGAFVFFIYLLLSLPFHFLDQIDENILNNISTNVPLNVAFFVIFVVFAISFFGYFEITLPSSFANKMDNASSVGGLLGSFFMALTLAIVSFSCTGPILGSLLAGSLSKDGGAIQLTVGMGGFGLALGIPFAIFAAFPGMLKSLPKSGGWLNSVKVVLGFIELALALKFLSQADLVDHWGILKYELFIGLWVIIFALMALYIFGKIKFPHDSPIKKLSFFRISFGVLVVSWVIYLASGFRYDERYNTYHSLTLLSGLAPPVGYSWIYPKHCPHNLDCEHDYQLALERAKRENKPIFVDFTGYACVNCRKMEEHVWIEPEVLEKLANDFIVVSLYVDDREELPKELQETYSYEVNGIKKNKEIKTVGDRWAAFEIATFNSNAQPLYAIVSPDERLMNGTVGYTPDKNEYLQWLNCGLEAFKEGK
jgi:thiol:disulfide interchange protein DsbD